MGLLEVLLVVIATAANANPVVETPFGRVEGFEHKEANVFLGIRYGKAPVGELRFEKPQIVPKWTETLKATAFGQACYQTALPVPNYANLSFSEDCLMINIMVPKTSPPNEGFPVMFYIHGGGFEFRSATELGYEKIVDHFVSRKIVFVTFSYRLGPLGFLTTSDDVLPGNLGLWDQSLAMDFAREILPSFGGNVDEITILGVSAGSASVSAFTISPHTNTKFQRAIQISGSMFANYAIDTRTDSSSSLFIGAIECQKRLSKAIMECLKQKDVEEFLKAAKVVGGDWYQVGGVRYHPRLDFDFFPTDLQTLIKKAPKIPSIIGLTDAELGLQVFDKSNGTVFAAVNFDSHTIESLKESLKKIAFGSVELSAHFERFYANPTREELKDPLFPVRKQLQISSDIIFTIPAAQEILEKLDNDWPVYLYLEDYFSDLPLLEGFPIKGAFHANEMAYMFGLDQPLPILEDENDKKFTQILVEMMESFTKRGKPEVQKNSWIPAEKGRLRYLNLNLKSSMKERGFFEDSIDFWTKLAEEVDPDLLKDITPLTGRAKETLRDRSEF
ncbi:hypothetical protein L596_007047 [Steinernema carpocapsae]|uniref:Carboxylic ester hydrolase n=2 Tax=Steinernema carpocapsae TaxID=34508 RepID=A0A4U5P8G9_STECR|nr:hypothetical protein L596_007047 [Steinernema carpocapsae]